MPKRRPIPDWIAIALRDGAMAIHLGRQNRQSYALQYLVNANGFPDVTAYELRGSGSPVALAQFSWEWVPPSPTAQHLVKARLRGWDLRVSPKHQGQGLADAMYDMAERESGVSIVPGDMITDEGRAFWERRRLRPRENPAFSVDSPTIPIRQGGEDIIVTPLGQGMLRTLLADLDERRLFLKFIGSGNNLIVSEEPYLTHEELGDAWRSTGRPLAKVLVRGTMSSPAFSERQRIGVWILDTSTYTELDPRTDRRAEKVLKRALSQLRSENGLVDPEARLFWSSYGQKSLGKVSEWWGGDLRKNPVFKVNAPAVWEMDVERLPHLIDIDLLDRGDLWPMFRRDGKVRFIASGHDMIVSDEQLHLSHENLQRLWQATGRALGPVIVRGYATGRDRRIDEVTVWILNTKTRMLLDPRTDRKAEKGVKYALGQLKAEKGLLEPDADLILEHGLGMAHLGRVKEWW